MLFYSDNCRMIFFFLCMLCFLRTMTIMAIYYFLAFFALRFSSLLTLLSVFYHPCKQNLSAVNSLFPSYFPLPSICSVNHASSFAIMNFQNFQLFVTVTTDIRLVFIFLETSLIFTLSLHVT